MCFNPLAAMMPQIPRMTPLPQAPRRDSDEIRRVKLLQEERLNLDRQGSFGTVKTNLDPMGIMPARKVLLGA